MINLEVKTSLTIEDLSNRLKAVFGKEGLGLDLVEDSADCLNFKGSGGFVNAVICAEEGKTKIELSTQEWDKQVKDFVSHLPR
jgi:hypothetical protein